MSIRNTKYKISDTVSSGQALVLVLLSLAVVLTIVLFILARSVTDIAVSSRSSEAVRAFSAAEAGIENALVIGQGTGLSNSVNIGNASYTSAVSQTAEGTPNYNYPFSLSSGDSMTTWFISHDANGNLECTDGKCFAGSSVTVCWGEQGTSASDAQTPAIEVSIFYATTPGDWSTIRIARRTVDAYSGRSPANGFGAVTGGTCSINGVSYAFQKLIQFDPSHLNIPTNGLLFARVRMFYNTDKSQPLGVTVAGGNLPSQGQNIVSTGSAGNANRKVAVFESWPEPPQVFDYSIYNSTGLSN